MAKIPNGAIILARQSQGSDIWTNKPSWWLKVWIFILMIVNHDDDQEFKRGTNFFTMDKIYERCFLQNDHIKYRTIDNVIRFLKLHDMITTQKTTRGMVITVCNYDYYQDLNNYKNDTKKSFGTTRKRDENDTINKNGNNGKNEQEDKYIVEFEKLWKKYPSKDGVKSARKHFTATVKTDKNLEDINKALDNYLHHLETEDWKRAKNGSTWFNNWEDWINWEETEPEDGVQTWYKQKLKEEESANGPTTLHS